VVVLVLRIIFMGTAEFGLPVLERLIDNRKNIIKVITQPDRPQGRGKKILPSPIKKVALEKGIEVFQPEKVNEENSIKKIKEFNPDPILVVAYGQILSRKILDLPRLGCINIHASLLPKYRGAAPINRAIINGEKETGITYIWMSEKVDAGDILYQKKTVILADETFGELKERLAKLSGETVEEFLEKIERGELKRIPQDDRLATYAQKMEKEEGEIIWENKGEKIYNLIRGTTPYPGAFTFYKGKRLKITRARFLSHYFPKLPAGSFLPGSIVRIEDDGLLVYTGDEGMIKILRLIPAGAREMLANQFVQGYKIKEGEVLSRHRPNGQQV